jgi:hypothetical protein
VVFEHTIPVLEWAKTFRASGRATTVTACRKFKIFKIMEISKKKKRQKEEIYIYKSETG